MSSEDSPTEQHSAPNRRSVLKSIGAAAAATTAATGTVSAIDRNEVDIWVWRTTNVASNKQQVAVDALEGAIDQIGYSREFDVWNQGELDGNWPGHGTYDSYLAEFDQQRPWTYDGDLHYLVYKQPLLENYSATDEAAAGMATDALRSHTRPRAIVNADWANVELWTVYENFVKHELLHTILDGTSAPHPGNEHSYGSQVGWLLENTPMLTGYAEDFRGGNEKPYACCNSDTVENSNYHTGSLSSCTINEAQQWMQEEY